MPKEWERGDGAPDNELGYLAHGPVILGRVDGVTLGVQAVYGHTQGLLLPVVVLGLGAGAARVARGPHHLPGESEQLVLRVRVNGDTRVARSWGGSGGGGGERFLYRHQYWIPAVPSDGRVGITVQWPAIGLPSTTTVLSLSPPEPGVREVLLLGPARPPREAPRAPDPPVRVVSSHGSSGGGRPEACAAVLDAGVGSTESFTLVLASGATRASMAAAFGADLTSPADEPEPGDQVGEGYYVFADIEGGAIAMEFTGYADPSPATLRALSAEGQRSAVLRSNVQAHLRFGCAENGVLVFDDDEFMFVDDPDAMPEALAPLFRTVWVDLDADQANEPESDSDPVAVALAMSEMFTGLQVTASQLAGAGGPGQYFVTGQSILGER